jgi:hypothetical protein
MLTPVREITLCLEVLVAMSGRWPLAQNCHTVLSDLQETCGVNIDVAENLPAESLQGRLRFAYNQDDNPLARKKRRLDPNVQFPRTGDAHAVVQEIGSSHQMDRREWSTNQVHASEMDAPDLVGFSPRTSRVPAGETQMNVFAADPPHTVPFPERPQQSFVERPFQGTHDDASLGAMSGFNFPGVTEQLSPPNFQVDPTWMTECGALGNWDSGMPDVFAGATWESLLQVINHDNLSWDAISR